MQVILCSAGFYNHRYILFRSFNHRLKLLYTTALIAISVSQAHAGILTEHQDVIINQAYVIELPNHAATVLIGNSDVADVMSQTGDTVIITGKRIGQTNLLIRDRAQNLVGIVHLNVRAADLGAITVYRGTTRAEYSCLDHCAVISSAPDMQTSNAPKALTDDNLAVGK